MMLFTVEGKIMNIPESDHPIWKIIRYAVVGGVMTVLCATLYRNGFDPKDIVLILTTLSGLAGYDQIKAKITKEE
jgi:hypothetical protein